MEAQTKTFNRLMLRIAALLIHAILNFIAISYLVNFDISGSWLKFIGFVLVVFFLIYLFLQHIVFFIKFLKTK